MRALAALLALLVLAGSAEAKTKRSHSARCAFLASQGYPDCRTPKGQVVDHKDPLCHTGPDGDVPGNMQLQSVAAAKLKDAEERKLCRALRR